MNKSRVLMLFLVLGAYPANQVQAMGGAGKIRAALETAENATGAVSRAAKFTKAAAQIKKKIVDKLRAIIDDILNFFRRQRNIDAPDLLREIKKPNAGEAGKYTNKTILQQNVDITNNLSVLREFEKTILQQNVDITNNLSVLREFEKMLVNPQGPIDELMKKTDQQYIINQINKQIRVLENKKSINMTFLDQVAKLDGTEVQMTAFKELKIPQYKKQMIDTENSISNQSLEQMLSRYQSLLSKTDVAPKQINTSKLTVSQTQPNMLNNVEQPSDPKKKLSIIEDNKEKVTDAVEQGKINIEKNAKKKKPAADKALQKTVEQAEQKARLAELENLVKTKKEVNSPALQEAANKLEEAEKQVKKAEELLKKPKQEVIEEIEKVNKSIKDVLEGAEYKKAVKAKEAAEAAAEGLPSDNQLREITSKSWAMTNSDFLDWVKRYETEKDLDIQGLVFDNKLQEFDKMRADVALTERRNFLDWVKQYEIDKDLDIQGLAFDKKLQEFNKMRADDAWTERRNFVYTKTNEKIDTLYKLQKTTQALDEFIEKNINSKKSKILDKYFPSNGYLIGLKADATPLDVDALRKKDVIRYYKHPPAKEAENNLLNMQIEEIWAKKKVLDVLMKEAAEIQEKITKAFTMIRDEASAKKVMEVIQAEQDRIFKNQLFDRIFEKEWTFNSWQEDLRDLMNKYTQQTERIGKRWNFETKEILEQSNKKIESTLKKFVDTRAGNARAAAKYLENTNLQDANYMFTKAQDAVDAKSVKK
jgi:hypothetical protein